MKDFNTAIDNMDTEAFIKMFDFATDSKYKPDEKAEALSDSELLEALGI